MRKTPILLSLCLVILMGIVLLSCGKAPQFIGLKNAEIVGLQDSLLFFNLDYVAFNPNKVNTKLKSSDVDIYYKNQWVGNGSITQGMSLPANDTIVAPVKCKVSLNQLQAFYTELMATDSAVFELRGLNKIGFALLNFNNKVDKEISLNIKSYLEDEIQRRLNSKKSFSIQKLAMTSLPGLTESAFDMEILIQNTLPFDYVLEDITLQFTPENNEEILATWQLEEPLTQKAQTETTLPVSVKVNPLIILKNSKLSWLLSQSAKLKVSGVIKISLAGNVFEIPISDVVAVGL